MRDDRIHMASCFLPAVCLGTLADYIWSVRMSALRFCADKGNNSRKRSKEMASRLLSAKICRDYPGRLAIVGDGRICTYEDLWKGIQGLTGKLRDMGVSKGDRVAIKTK